VTVAVIRSPFVAVTPRDAAWLAGTLTDLLERHYFDSAPALRDRVVELCSEMHAVSTGGQADDELLSIRDAARHMKCSTDTIRRRINAGALVPVRFGSLVRVRRADLEVS
jgi:excisionase family DNA binding protein